MARLLMEVSAARSGTNRLRQALALYPQAVIFLEAFNRRRPFLGDHLQDFTRFVELRFGPLGQDAVAGLRDWLHAEPSRAVGAMLAFAESRGAAVVSFKVFDDQLDRVQLLRIIRDHRPIGLILHRSPVDSYISFRKAKEADVWTSADTTGLRPTLEAEDFARYRSRNERYFRFAYTAFRASGCPAAVARYEDIYRDGSSPELFIERLLERLALDLGAPVVSDRAVFTKQDRATSNAEKVANWDAFVSDARRLGIDLAAPYMVRLDPPRFARWMVAYGLDVLRRRLSGATGTGEPPPSGAGRRLSEVETPK